MMGFQALVISQELSFIAKIRTKIRISSIKYAIITTNIYSPQAFPTHS